MPVLEGFTLLGPKTIGSFTNPNTIGVFASLSLVMLLLLRNNIHNVPIKYYLITAIICLSSGSRTAITLYVFTVLFLMILNNNNKIYKLLSIFIAIVGLSVTMFFINQISSKPEGLSILGGTRVKNLISYTLNNDSMTLLVGNGWGSNTSWYFALYGGSYTDMPNFVKLDSFYSSIIAQIGFVGMVIMMLFLGWLFSLGGKKGIYLFFTFCFISVQTNLLEYYPINFYYFIALGMLIFDQMQNRTLFSPIDSRLNILSV